MACAPVGSAGCRICSRPRSMTSARARPHVYAALQPTPLLRHPLLAERLGPDVWVKHENHNPTGAFKVRGGLNLIGAPVTRRSRARRHLGDHRQPRPVDGLCRRACRRAVHARRAAQQQPRQERDDARLGRDPHRARPRLRRGARARRAAVPRARLRYVHSANEPDLIAGVGTYALEIFERSRRSMSCSCRSAAAAARAA